MDILTLELFDVSISQGVLRVDQALKEHASIRLRILLGAGDETLSHNLQRLLERQQRIFRTGKEGSHLWIEVDPTDKPKATPTPTTLPSPRVLPAPTPRPALLLRSAFAPGDAFLGRRLLLGVLKTLEPPLPWLGLAHDALELLHDPQAIAVLKELKERGVPIRISADSLLFHGLQPQPFETMPDAEWQSLLGRGEIVVV